MCLPQCETVEARAQCPTLLLSNLSFRNNLSWNLDKFWLVWLASVPRGSSCLCHVKSGFIESCCHAWPFPWVGIELIFFILYKKHFNSVSYLFRPNLRKIFAMGYFFLWFILVFHWFHSNSEVSVIWKCLYFQTLAQISPKQNRLKSN